MFPIAEPSARANAIHKRRTIASSSGERLMSTPTIMAMSHASRRKATTARADDVEQLDIAGGIPAQ
jgi:hypothetical protein